MSVRLKLDHASLAVPDLDAAVEVLATGAGLETTRSPADPGRHGRIHLDRTYLEVAADPGARSWQCPLFFLRFDDLAKLRNHLASVGIEYKVGTYQGVDGTWDDVEVLSGGVPLPILVRRTHPPEVAADWPPALKRPHPGGAATLEQVHLVVTDLDAAAEVYSKLLGTPGLALRGPAGRPARVFAAPPGHIVLSRGQRTGIAAVVVGVSSHATPRPPLAEGPVTDVTWLDLPVASGVQIGFIQTGRAHRREEGSP